MQCSYKMSFIKYFWLMLENENAVKKNVSGISDQL